MTSLQGARKLRELELELIKPRAETIIPDLAHEYEGLWCLWGP